MDNPPLSLYHINRAEFCKSMMANGGAESRFYLEFAVVYQKQVMCGEGFRQRGVAEGWKVRHLESRDLPVFDAVYRFFRYAV